MFRIAVLVSLVVGACATDSSTGIDPSAITCPPESTLSYENYGQLVIEEQCLSCHASKERPKLGTLEDVRASRQPIMRTAVSSTSMPRGTGMLLEERQILGEWLACGAP